MFSTADFVSLPRNYFLPEAQDGDMVCAFGPVRGFFLLQPYPEGRFTLVGSAFRSARSERELEAVLLASLNIDHDALKDKDHEAGSLYASNVAVFDFDSSCRIGLDRYLVLQ